MTMAKLIINFHDSGKAKAFALKARTLPGVTYATDYCRTTGNFHVMVCGDLSDETEKLIKSKKI